MKDNFGIAKDNDDNLSYITYFSENRKYKYSENGNITNFYPFNKIDKGDKRLYLSFMPYDEVGYRQGRQTFVFVLYAL